MSRLARNLEQTFRGWIVFWSRWIRAGSHLAALGAERSQLPPTLELTGRGWVVSWGGRVAAGSYHGTDGLRLGRIWERVVHFTTWNGRSDGPRLGRISKRPWRGSRLSRGGKVSDISNL